LSRGNLKKAAAQLWRSAFALRDYGVMKWRVAGGAKWNEPDGSHRQPLQSSIIFFGKL